MDGLDVEQAHLVKMVNQIAANVPVPSTADSQVAHHLRSFWTPAMRVELADVAQRRPDLLRPEVLSALKLLTD